MTRETRRVLVVSTDERRESLSERVMSAHLVARSVETLEEAISFASEWRPHAVLVDAVALGTGAEPFFEAFRGNDGCLCALLTDEASGEAASAAMRVGADTVVPWTADASLLRRVLGWGDAGASQPPPEGSLPPFVVGSGPAMREVWRLVFLAAPDESSVLICGETGAGKEVIARALHRFSARRNGPFVAVNCAALPDGLLESELFGYEKGAFTGAASRRLGRFERANGGTLLLDEIGDLPHALQAKLLRVLQERTFERLGGTSPVGVDVRVVAATHRDLGEACARGAFRSDLYYRLNTLTIRVPPLRECREDVLGLWQHLLAAGAQKRGRPVPTTDAGATRLLLRHDWPGNVRELQNAAAHALTVSVGDTITPTDLPEHLREQLGSTRAPGLLGLTLREAERELILQTFTALKSAAETAAMLGISIRKVQYRLKEYREEDLAKSDASGTVESKESTAAIDLASPHVLLAEDDDEMRWALEDFLQGGGFSVTAVANGRAALERLSVEGGRASQPDVVLTDVRMPGMTGLQLLQALRERGSSVPVIVISAFADERSEAEARSLGASAFLPKPIDTARLEQAIRRAVLAA